MNINRDEALRAKELAQGLMRKCDFNAARKLALKANQMDPTLENITHMTMVCDVHCAAAEKELDWYGILQVDTKADDISIKKQYRRLALLLHPDKNKLPGAESAFKLIGEAQSILLDKAKRNFYDIKRKPWSKPAPAPAPASAPVYKTQHVPRNRAQPTDTGESKKLIATNLSLHVKRSHLEEFFKEAGQVVNVTFSVSRYDPPRLVMGIGVVEFATVGQAHKALEFRGRPLLGFRIRLEVSHVGGQRPPYTPQSRQSSGACPPR